MPIEVVFLLLPLCCQTRSSTHLLTTPCHFPLSSRPQTTCRFCPWLTFSLGYIHNPTCTTTRSSVSSPPPSLIFLLYRAWVRVSPSNTSLYSRNKIRKKRCSLS